MNLSFLAGALSAWIVLTPQGKKFGDYVGGKAMQYVKENLLKEKKDAS